MTTDVTTCPKCGGKMKLGRVRQHTGFTEKRRSCEACGHHDKVYVKVVTEILKIVEVLKREKQLVRVRTKGQQKTKRTSVH